MTAITLNLLAEEQRAQEARARDPIKLFVAIGLAALTVVVGAGATLSAMLMQKRSELQGLQAEWNSLNNGGAEEGEFRAGQHFGGRDYRPEPFPHLVCPAVGDGERHHSRVHSAFLDQLCPEQGSPEANAAARMTPAANVASHRKSSERLVLRLEGVASSSRPELEVDQFIKTLRADARFSAVVEDIQLRSISRVSPDSDKTGGAPSAASFVIECWYKDNVTK